MAQSEEFNPMSMAPLRVWFRLLAKVGGVRQPYRARLRQALITSLITAFRAGWNGLYTACRSRGPESPNLPLSSSAFRARARLYSTTYWHTTPT